MKRRLRQVALALGVLVVGAAGAGIALAIAAGLGKLGSKTVVTEQVQPSSADYSQSKTGTGLSIQEIYKRTAPAVVDVQSTSVVSSPANPFFQLPPQTQEALGSGFVIDKQGDIVTNYHVVAGAKSITVSFSNNERLKATVVGEDKSTDLAVLRVSSSPRALAPLTFGDSSTLQPGDEVVAIGNPFALDRSVTSGIVSALHRPLESSSQYSIPNVIQTDAAINHGNSGGPLLNDLGQVIGVNTAIFTGGTSEGNVGVGFAIPSDTVKSIVAQLIKNGKATHANLGIRYTPITTQMGDLFRLPTRHGLLIVSVRKGSGAAKAGLKGSSTSATVAGETYQLGGDIIVAVDGKPVVANGNGDTSDVLQTAVQSHKPGDKLSLEIYRGSKKMTVSVTLGNRS